MHVIAQVSIVPVGVGPSVSDYLASCKKVFEESGLEHEMHANGTNVQGEWDDVCAAVRQCHQVIQGLGAPRVLTTLQLDTRTDRDQTLSDRVESVRDKLAP